MLLIQVAALGTNTANNMVKSCGWEDSTDYKNDAGVGENEELYVCGIYCEDEAQYMVEVQSIEGLKTAEIKVISNIAERFYDAKFTAFEVNGLWYIVADDFINKLG